MAALCGIHCLVTPVLLVALPILATTFWTSSNFHLWMLCFVLPTTALATYSGCRRHMDKAVAALAVAGVALLLAATLWERAGAPEPSFAAHSFDESSVAGDACGSCCSIAGEVELETGSVAGISLPLPTILNLLGGLLLSGGHWRNFRLCRSGDCGCKS